MTSFKISIKRNERIYINGAVIQFDRKTTLEFLNDVQFLLESHVLRADQADTPLKRLYFTTQILLMAPNDAQSTIHLFKEQLSQLLVTFDDERIMRVLKELDKLVRDQRFYEAMKSLRPLFAIEQEIFERSNEPDFSEWIKQPATIAG